MARVSTAISVSAYEYTEAEAVGQAFRALSDAVAATTGTVVSVKGVTTKPGRWGYWARIRARVVHGRP